MTLLEGLQSHRGGLLHIKSQLYWYAGRGWDGVPGRICLVLDAAVISERLTVAAPWHASAAGVTRIAAPRTAAVLLLIDGAPHWVWVSQEDVELIT